MTSCLFLSSGPPSSHLGGLQSPIWVRGGREERPDATPPPLPEPRVKTLSPLVIPTQAHEKRTTCRCFTAAVRPFWGGPGKSLSDGMGHPPSGPTKPGLRDSPPFPSLLPPRCSGRRDGSLCRRDDLPPKQPPPARDPSGPV